MPPWMPRVEFWWWSRLEYRFRSWFAAQQANRDAGVAVLYLALSVDSCFWQASRRFSAGSSALVPILLLLPMLLVCCGILLLQVCFYICPWPVFPTTPTSCFVVRMDKHVPWVQRYPHCCL